MPTKRGETDDFLEDVADTDRIFFRLGMKGLELLEFTDVQILRYFMGRRGDIAYDCFKNGWDVERFAYAIEKLNFKKRVKTKLIDKFKWIASNGGKWVGAENAYSDEHFEFLHEDGYDNTVQERLQYTQKQVEDCLLFS